jgi:hypothetical protein
MLMTRRSRAGDHQFCRFFNFVLVAVYGALDPATGHDWPQTPKQFPEEAFALPPMWFKSRDCV